MAKSSGVEDLRRLLQNPGLSQVLFAAGLMDLE